MADTYSVYFGEVGSMTLRSADQAGLDFTIETEELENSIEYEWRIDTTNEYGTTYGVTWSFTTIAFSPPSSNIVTKKRLIVVGKNKLYYEDV